MKYLPHVALLLMSVVLIAAGPSPSSLPTGIDEATFKGWHELKKGTTPPHNGTDLTVGGEKAYLSLPTGAKGPMPAVIVIHEWWGLNDNIKHWADRLAADGYAALAIDLYSGTVATTRDDVYAAMKKVDATKAAGVLKAAHAFLASDPRIRATDRGVIGWCFGGGWSLQHALATPDLDAAVIYYGRLVTDATELRKIKAPVLGVFGTQDKGIPAEQVKAFKGALLEAGVKHELHMYTADHAFANPSSAHYDHKSATKAWAEVRRFLSATLSR